jgi:multiple sugar transport system substrate-binding protein
MLGRFGAGGAAMALLAACGSSVSAPATVASTAASQPGATSAATTAVTSAATSSAAAASVVTTAATTTTVASSATASVAAVASAPGSAGVTLNFLHWWTVAVSANDPAYMAWAFAEFKKRSGITVNPIEAKPVGDTYTKFVAGVMAGDPPDVSFTSVVYGRDMYDQGLVAELDSYIAKAPDVQDDQYFAASKQFRQARGHTFGIPVMGPESLCLGINQDLFRAASLDPQGADIKTWDDLVRVAQKLTKTGADGKVTVSGLAMPNSMDLATFTGFVESTGHPLYDAEQNAAYFNAPETVAALQYLTDLANKHNVSPPLSQQDRAGGEAALVAGTAAMEFDESAMGAFATITKATNLKWWMVPYPQAPTGKGPATVTWINFTVMPKNGKHPAEAFEFLRFFCGPDAALKKLEMLNAVAPRLDLYTTPQWAGVVKALPAQQMIPEIAKLPGVYPYHHNADQGKQVVPLLAKAYQGQMDVKSALDEAQRLADTIFAQK